MADQKSPVNILQRVILELQENIKNQGQILKTLKDVNKQLQPTTKSLTKFDNAIKKASTSISGMQKSMRVLGQVAKKTTSAFGLMTGAVAGIAQASKKISIAQEPLVRFATLSKDASVALQNLRSAYESLGAAATISLKDAGKAMNVFMSKGIIAQIQGSRPEFQKAMVQLREMLVKSAGATLGEGMFDALTGSIDPSKMGLFVDAMTKNEIGTRKWREEIAQLGAEAANNIYPIANTLQNLGKSTDQIIESYKSWADISKKLTSIFENLGVKILDAFGPQITAAIATIEKDVLPAIQSEIGKLIDWWNKHKSTVVDTIAAAYEKLKYFLDLIVKAPDWIKALGVAFFFFKPLITTLASLAIQFIAVTAQVALQIIQINALTAAYTRLAVAQGASMAAGAGKGAFLSLGRVGAGLGGVGIASAAGAAHQFYKWGSEGAGATLGGAGSELLMRKSTAEDVEKRGFFGRLFKGSGGVDPAVMKQMREQEEKLARIEELKEVRAQRGPSKLKQTFDKVSEVGKKTFENIKKAITDSLPSLDKFENALKDIVGLKSGLEGLSSSMSSIGTLIETFGPNAAQFGNRFSGMLDEIVTRAKEAAKLNLEIAYAAYETAKALTDSVPHGKQRLLYAKQEAEALEEVKNLSVLYKTAIEDSTVKQKKNIQLQQLQTNIYERNLEISQALYGTPALAVGAIQQVVQSLQIEKEHVQAALKIHEDNLALFSEEDKAMGLHLADLEQSLKYREQEKAITAKQLQQVKALRDGYLDAVQAQAFGAGAFEKIIITQEKNLMRGLQARAVKQNYLVGQYGAQAGIYNKQAVRFGSGENILESLSGENFTRTQALADLNNIADPIAKEIAQSSQDMVMGLHESSEAIDRFAKMMSYITGGTGAYAGGGNRPGSVAIGEAMRTAAPGISIPMITPHKYSTGSGNWQERMKNLMREFVEFAGVVDMLLDDYEPPTGLAGEGRGRALLPGG